MQFSKKVDLALWITLLCCVSVSLITTITVIAIMGEESIKFFSHVSLSEFFLGTKWEPLVEPQTFGVLPLVCGSFLVVIGSIFLALPLGLAVAIYLSEFAKPTLRAFLKPVLEVLAGIPTVVYGYFALTFITPWLKSFLPEIEVFNALSAIIVVAIMILPMIVSLCDDGFRALPRSLREGGYALGATKLEVSLYVVMHSSVGQISAATILAISRAIGETMAVVLAAGANPNLTFNPLESIQTMTAYIVQVSLGDIPADSIGYQTSYAVGTLLFIITFGMNIIGNWVISKREF
ncbi:MAG: phosphate ABC transporter permease subunit PstC [Oligoflexales bacterium]